MKLSDNTILITGATSGIGLGLAQRFLAEGNTVIVAGRREDRLRSIAAQHNGIHPLVLDITDPASIHRCLGEVRARFPGLNVLINNAGIMLPEDLTDPDHLDVAERTVATNLLGPVRMLNAFLPSLIGKAHATIINVTSGRAFVPLALTPTYSATKAAMHSYTESLRIQLRGQGVEVLELVPPRVRTDLMGQATSDQAMPLADYLNEVMDLLRAAPQATEICVESVKVLRFAEANGTYQAALSLVDGVH